MANINSIEFKRIQLNKNQADIRIQNEQISSTWQFEIAIPERFYNPGILGLN